MSRITKHKHEIMWWMSRLTIMLTSLFLSFSLAASAYAAEIQMGKDGMLQQSLKDRIEELDDDDDDDDGGALVPAVR